MADQNRKDDLADALARMAAGEVSDDENPQTPAGGLSPTGRPATPTPRPHAPVPRPVSAEDAASRSADGPGEGTVQRSPRPLPTVSIDASLVPGGRPTPARHAGGGVRQATELMNRLEYRRTIIPSLLTLGGLLLLTGLGVLALGEDWVIGGLPAWLGVCLGTAGVGLLAAGWANAVIVQRELRGQQ